MRQSFVVRHLDRAPLLLRKLRQSFPYVSAGNRLQHSFREVGAYLFDVGEVDRDLPGLLASLDPQSVDRLVVDEGHDERVEPSAGDVDPVGLPPDGEQHFLHDVLRGWAVAENAIGKTEGLAPQPFVKNLHSKRVPASQTVDRKSTRLNSSHMSISYAV